MVLRPIRNQLGPRTPEEIFGRVLRGLRHDLGLSQEELAFRCRLHRTYISQLERGLKSPTLGTMLRLAPVLEIRTAELVSRVELAMQHYDAETANWSEAAEIHED